MTHFGSEACTRDELTLSNLFVGFYLTSKAIRNMMRSQAALLAYFKPDVSKNVSVHNRDSLLCIQVDTYYNGWVVAIDVFSQEKIWGYLKQMRTLNASDLIISSSNPIKMRIRGVLKSLQTPELKENEVMKLLKLLIPEKELLKFNEQWDLDLSIELKQIGRFRVNLLKHRLGTMAVLRFISPDIPKPEQLGLNNTIKNLMNYHQGLVMVTGPIRSGKTTTLASLVQMINVEKPKHIITIEDPIEYVFPKGKALVNQRQVGKHTQSTAAAMRAALREDPDIIMVGEMRDLETMELAIGAAETGHLVLSTLQTKSAAKTIDRIVDTFPPRQVEQIRTLLSGSLKGIISQKLIPAKDGKRMVMASEILLSNISLANMIKEGKTFQIPSVMQMGKAHGMRTLNESILSLVEGGHVGPAHALAACHDPSSLMQQFKQKGIEV